MTTKDKRASVPQAASRKRPGVKRTTVLIPNEIHRRIAKAARMQRRGLSPMVVVLVERGLQAMEASAV